MVQFEELLLRLEGSQHDIEDLSDALGLNAMMSEIEQLELRATEPGFWDDVEKSQAVLQKTGALKGAVEEYNRLKSHYDDAHALIELANEEEDEGLYDEALSDYGLSDFERSAILVEAGKFIRDEDALDAMLLATTDMRHSVAVMTYKELLFSGNDVVRKLLDDSIESYTGEEGIHTAEQLDVWLELNPDDEDDEERYGGCSDDCD